jgi:hypothetical protein
LGFCFPLFYLFVFRLGRLRPLDYFHS